MSLTGLFFVGLGMWFVGKLGESLARVFLRGPR